MDMVEVQINEYCMAAFDGRVLEIFGGEVRRYHVKLLAVTVAAPDKKGQRRVTLSQAQRSWDFPLLDESQFATFQPVLDALTAAGVTVTS